MPSQITVHVAGSERAVEQGTTAADLFADDRQVVVARVGGELRDLAHVLEDGDVVEPVLVTEDEGLAVLRHSLPIAEIEREKLGRTDPLYGYRMMKAYIAAEKGERAVALEELEAAVAASVPGDDAWTCAAEVHAILSDTDRVIESLRKAAARKEPTASYVLSSPLFRYLENEERFQDVRAMFAAQQTEVRTAMAALN